jgi:ABC-type nickel/cobalt efflux system permease component RcnA
MKENAVIVFLVAVLAAQSLLFAQDNPFISKKPHEKIEKTTQYPGFINKFLKNISTLQRRLNQKITELSKELKEKKSAKPILIILFITFIYGMVHALGPGHGKTVTFSYFLSEHAQVKKGIMVGTLIGFLHAASALILVLVLYFIIQQSFLRPIEDLSRIIKLISYALITLIGLLLLFKATIALWRKEKNAGKSTYENSVTTKGIIPFAIAVGIIPCTGAVIVLLFSISMGILGIGIISTLCMALGMATTISLVAVSTILAKKGVTKFIINRPKMNTILQTTLSIIGALLLTLLGILLFTSTL